MNLSSLQNLLETLTWCSQAQLKTVEVWHRAEPSRFLLDTKEPSLDLLKDLVLDEHLTNFQLWHLEDEARRDDAGPEHVAQCKRKIDSLNQQRNDGIEAVDTCLIQLLQPLLPARAQARYNTETLGTALDRLSILCLKRYHMAEQLERPDVSEEHKDACCRKLAVLEEQHTDLRRSVLELVQEYGDGYKKPKVYYQFKMYNDPNLNPQLYGRKAESS